MKIATWNVNSIRVRLPQVLEWLKKENPDVLCLQETKITDADFPAAALLDAGYQPVYAGQKTYNGVATLSRAPVTDRRRSRSPALRHQTVRKEKSPSTCSMMRATSGSSSTMTISFWDSTSFMTFLALSPEGRGPDPAG